MNEIFKDISGYEGKYQVSNQGNVKSLNYNKSWKEKLLTPLKSKDWYYSVWLSFQKAKRFRINRLVALTFIENINKKTEVNHKNWIKSDNRLENLEWCTRWENQKHAISMWLKKVPTPSKGKFWKDHFNSKKIIQSKEGIQIKIWNSITEAAIFCKIAVPNISKVCKKKLKTAGWYEWEYL